MINARAATKGMCVWSEDAKSIKNTIKTLTVVRIIAEVLLVVLTREIQCCRQGITFGKMRNQTSRGGIRLAFEPMWEKLSCTARLIFDVDILTDIRYPQM